MMKYRMVRENRPTLKNFGRWKAVAVHERTVETRQVVNEVCRRTGASRGSVVAVLIELAGVVSEHLREGDRVRIDDFGLLKLEIEGDKVDDEELEMLERSVKSEKSVVRGVRLHVLAESRHGRQALYDGLQFRSVESRKVNKSPQSKNTVPQNTNIAPRMVKNGSELPGTANFSLSLTSSKILSLGKIKEKRFFLLFFARLIVSLTIVEDTFARKSSNFFWLFPHLIVSLLQETIMQVVYEDNHIIIVSKRSGEIVQGDKTGDEPLSETVKGYLKDKYQKPGNVFLGVVHRLDRPVWGLVVFARTSKALSRLNAMFARGEVHKTYWAIVPKTADADDEWHELEHWLVRNEQQNKSYAYAREVPRSKRAVLRYRVIGRSDRYQLLEVRLLTGRHHQIRCQLAKAGMPIKGDLKYGSPRSNPDGSIALLARRVEFQHPVSHQPIVAEAPLPEGTLFGVFGE